jgi:hypothetical protein
MNKKKPVVVQDDEDELEDKEELKLEVYRDDENEDEGDDEDELEEGADEEDGEIGEEYAQEVQAAQVTCPHCHKPINVFIESATYEEEM